MGLSRTLEQRVTELAEVAQGQHGLSYNAAIRYALLGAIIEELHGVAAPRIVSGYRSQAKQDAMRAAWDRGDRAGLVTRPAEVSNHTSRNAWDVERGPGLDRMAEYAPLLGVRWGGTFQRPDPIHFDLG